VAKLYLRYGAMNSGKSTALLQAAYNYEERGLSVILAKPQIDTKTESTIESRLGVSREAAVIFAPNEDLYARLGAERTRMMRDNGSKVHCVLVDEAQFLTEVQADDLLRFVVLEDIPVVAYGIRTDFQTVAFPGSRRLLEIAHSIEELKTICRCGRKAIFSARKLGGRFVFDGDQVAIDGVDAMYEPLCASCYLDESDGRLGAGWRPRAEVSYSAEPDPDFT
jgi:thymidine kinase